jgi:hypothetical protein
MTMMKKNLLAVGLLALSAMAAAAAPATVITDLNLRRGPGTGHAVVGVMRAGMTVDVGDCNGAWCSVAFGGLRGYASQMYLAPAMAGPGGLPLLGGDGVPRLNLRDIGTSIGSIIGVDIGGFLAPPSSPEGGYYPPNRRLFPAYGEDARHRYDGDPGPQYVEPWHGAVRSAAPPAARHGLNRAADDPEPEIYGSPATVPMAAQPDMRMPARSEAAAVGGSADLKR